MFASVAGMYMVIMYGSYAMFLMMPYLTENWGLSITQAAVVINTFDGVVAIIPMGLKVLVDFVGMPRDFWIVLLGGITGTLGLALVTISTAFDKFTDGMSSNHEGEECADPIQRGLMFAGLGLLAIGMATCLSSTGEYMINRIEKMNIKRQEIVSVSLALATNAGTEKLQEALSKAGSSLQPERLMNIAYHWPTENWLVRSIIAIDLPLLAVLVFVPMPCCWKFGVPVIISAFVTSMFVAKPWYNVPSDAGAVDHRAPLLGNSQENKQEDQEKVEILRTLPLWPAFIICGLVSSIGNTYFMEQSELMSHKLLGTWEVPATFFVIFYKVACKLISKLCELRGFRQLLGSKGGIGVSLLFAVACCTTAALLEGERLYVLATSQGLIGNLTEGEAEDEGVVPLSVFLMLPQFFLLAFLDTTYGYTVFAFFRRLSTTYANCLTNMALGVGILGGVVSVYIAGSVNKDWFRHTLNDSRLDQYYWMLAVLSAIGLVIYGLLIFVLGCDFGSQQEMEGEEGEEEEEGDEEEYRRVEWFEFLPLRR